MRITDISQGWHVGMPRFDAEWYPPFMIERAMTPESDPAQANRTFSKLYLFPHNASHVESSLHFDPHGDPIEAVCLSRFIGPAVVADLSHASDLDPITGADLERAVQDYWQDEDRLIIRTDHPLRNLGSSDYWDSAPYLTPSAADWIVEHRAALVGLDCLTERPGDQTFTVHRRILGSGIPLLENLANLHKVAKRVVWLVAPPIKVADVEAAPARPVVIEGLNVFEDERGESPKG